MICSLIMWCWWMDTQAKECPGESNQELNWKCLEIGWKQFDHFIILFFDD